MGTWNPERADPALWYAEMQRKLVAAEKRIAELEEQLETQQGLRGVLARAEKAERERDEWREHTELEASRAEIAERERGANQEEIARLKGLLREAREMLDAQPSSECSGAFGVDAFLAGLEKMNPEYGRHTALGGASFYDGGVAECRTCGMLITWGSAQKMWVHRGGGDPRHHGVPGKFRKQKLSEPESITPPNDGNIYYTDWPPRFNARDPYGQVLPEAELCGALNNYGIDLVQSNQWLPNGWILRDRATNLILGSAYSLMVIELLLDRLRIIEVPSTCTDPVVDEG